MAGRDSQAIQWQVLVMDEDLEPLGELAAKLRECEDSLDNLESAIKTRQMIGMAQGMVMLRYGLGQERAFEFMSRQSQAQNIKVREIARRIVATLPEDPWPEPTS